MGAEAANLADLVEAAADAYPGREAVATLARSVTYAELDERANRFAHLLCGLGASAGTTVGLAVHNRPEFLEALLGTFKVRAVPVNVNYRYRARELHYLLADADPLVVVHEPELGEELDTAVAALRSERGPRWRAPVTIATGGPYEDRLAAAPTHRPSVRRSGDDRYLLYTGGTTGLPKGVEWRHDDLLHGALGGRELSIPGTRALRLLAASPLVHGTAQWLALMTLVRAGTVLLAGDPGLDPVKVWDLAEQRHAGYLGIVGDAYAGPLTEALDREPHRWDLTELLVVVSGGAALSATLRRRLLDHVPWAAMVDGYGSSESGGHGQMAVFAGQDADTSLRFLPDEDTAVLDAALRPVAPGSGTVGRLARRGHIPVGYRNDPDRTRATFPVINGERWAIPGDLATVEADGHILLLGRGSDVINSGGEKVFPDEVEGTLLEHPAVAEAVVVGVDDPRWGERVTAVVVARQGEVVVPADLERHCRSRLATFKVPRSFVVTDAVQHTVAHKVDRAWARQLAAAG